MNPRTPPRLAVLLLKWFGIAKDEAFAGDLIEEFDGGRTAGWFWRQTGSAILISVGKSLLSSGRVFLPFLLGSCTESAVDFSASRLLHAPVGLRVSGIVAIVFVAIALMMGADLHIRMHFWLNELSGGDKDVDAFFERRCVRRWIESRRRYLVGFAVFLFVDLIFMAESPGSIRLAELCLPGWMAARVQSKANKAAVRRMYEEE